MQDRAETATTGSDEIAKAKAEVKQEINKAREPSKPAAEVSAAENALAQKLLNELSEKATAARKVRDVDKATGGLSIETKRKEAIAVKVALVKVALVKVLEAVKEGIITPPAKTKVVLTELAERAGRLTDTSASYLQPLLEKYIGRELTFSKADQEPTQFEKDFRQLNKDNPNAAQLLGQILIDNVGELGDITKDDLSKQLELNLDEEGKVRVPEEKEERVQARGGADDQREERSKKFEQWVNKFNSYYNKLPELLNRRLRPRVEQEIKRRHEGEDLAKISQQLDSEIDQELERQLAAKLSKFNALNKAIYNTESGREQNIRDYRDNILNLYNEGLLRKDEYDGLLKLSDELPDLLKGVPAGFDRSSGGLREQLLHHRIRIKPEHEKIVDALGDAEKLKELLRREYRVAGSPEMIDFEKFYRHVKEVAEDILSIIDLDPGQFFEQAFNPFYQGSGYIIFTDAIRTVGQQLSRDEEFKKMQGRFYDIKVRENQQEVGITPEQSTPYLDPFTMGIGELITRVLTNRVISLRNIYEYLHNTDLIVEEGRGFETLAQYAEKVVPADLDWFLYEDKDLATAYNLYIQNIRQELYLENRIMTPQFGKRDATGLDVAQHRALAQIRALRAKDERLTQEGSEVARLIRKIRQAGGLAKGYTGEYWVLMLGAYLPMKYEKYVDREGEKWRFKQTYKGGGESGPEKMATQIKPEATWIRFGIPAHLPALPYVYQRRDLNEYESWDHTTVYKVKKEREHSYIAGATPWYLDFAKKHIRLGEHLTYKVVGAYLRGGWRIEGYKGFISFKKGEKGEVTNYYDFYKTVGNLMTAGPYALKAFFDNLEVSKVDAKTIEEMLGVKDFNRLSKSQREKLVKEELKRACYREFLFGWMFDVTPTKALGFERREFTPGGEKLIIEEIWERLKKKYGEIMPEEDIKTKLTPLFVDALELIARDKLKSKESEDAFLAELENASSLDRFRTILKKKELTETDLNSSVAVKMLQVLYDEFKTIIGESSYQGKRTSLAAINFEEFRKTLPELLSIMRKSLSRKRSESGIKKDKNDIDLIDRFMFWGEQEQNIHFAEFGGEDLDISRMFLQGGGRRMPARYMGETQIVAKAFTENIQKYYDGGTAAMAMTNTERLGRDEFDRFIAEKIAPPLVEIRNGLSQIDMNWADEFAVRHTIFFNRIVEKDHKFRMVGLGSLRGSFERRSTGRQESLNQDHFVTSFYRPTYSLDADNSDALCRALLTATHVPFSPTNIAKAGYAKIGLFNVPDIYEYEIDEKTKLPKPVYEEKPFKLFGKKLFTYKVPKIKEQAKYKWHADLVKKSEGHVLRNKIIDRFIPIAIFVLFLIMLQLGWAAKQKNEGK